MYQILIAFFASDEQWIHVVHCGQTVLVPDLVKFAKNTAEQGKVAIRNIRRDANDDLKKFMKSGDISEDDEKRAVDEIQKLTDSYIEKMNTLLESKEKEIMEV